MGYDFATDNKLNLKVSSFPKHSKEKCGINCTVSNTKFSSVTLNGLTMKGRERIHVISSFKVCSQ